MLAHLKRILIEGGGKILEAEQEEGVGPVATCCLRFGICPSSNTSLSFPPSLCSPSFPLSPSLCSHSFSPSPLCSPPLIVPFKFFYSALLPQIRLFSLLDNIYSLPPSLCSPPIIFLLSSFSFYILPALHCKSVKDWQLFFSGLSLI